MEQPSDNSLDSIVNEFMNNNQLDQNTQEKYIMHFKQKLGRFLAQQTLNSSPELKKVFIDLLPLYKYYSKTRIELFLQNFYDKICNHYKLNPRYTIYSPIGSEKDLARGNSSDFYLHKFLDINELESNIVININSLNLSTKIEKYQNKLNQFEELKKKLEELCLLKELAILESLKEDLEELEKSKEDKNEFKALKKLKHMKNVILIDDFSGSGKTIKTFLKNSAHLIRDKKIFLYVFHLTETAKKRIKQAFVDNNYANYEIIYEDLSDSIFEVERFQKSKTSIEDFEKEKIRSTAPLGFSKCASLVTFSRNCPNNTLSSFWFTSDTWSPLFPRRERTLDFFGEDIEKIKKNINYNLSMRIPYSEKGNFDFKSVLTLMYIKDAKEISEEIELYILLGYNNTQLLEHLNSLINMGFLDTNKQLTKSSKDILKRLKLLKLSLKDLSIDAKLEFSEDALPLDSLYIPSQNN